MASHKAPTQVTVVTEEKSALTEWVEKNWKLGAIAAIVISVGILGIQYTREQSRQSSMALWDQLNDAASLSPATGQISGDPAALEAIAAELKGTAAEPFALAAQVQVALGDRDYDTAGEAVSQIREAGFEPLSERTFAVGENGAEQTLTDHLATRIAAQKKWEAEHSGLFENAPLPEGSPRVEMETTAGKIVLGLYQEAAPKHVENFLKLVDEDFYVGTKFHRVLKDFMIQGGDPNTKDIEKIDEWGQGGPGYKIDREDSGLNHFEGFLSAAKQPSDIQSSGSQFFITTGDANWLDGQHVVFGKVLEGMDVVEQIETGEIDPDDQAGSRPLQPVEILSVKRL